MRAHFELNDSGTCNRFTLIRGVQKTHTFINEGRGGSKLRFEGTQAEFEYLMRDIYGVNPSLRTKPIFVFVEMPNLTEIQEHITVLTNTNAALEAQLAAANKIVDSIFVDEVTHPFPLTAPETKAATSGKPDVGLPVGPGEPPGAAKGKAEPGPVAPKLTRAAWLKLSPEAKRALAAVPQPVAQPKKTTKSKNRKQSVRA